MAEPILHKSPPEEDNKSDLKSNSEICPNDARDLFESQNPKDAGYLPGIGSHFIGILETTALNLSRLHRDLTENRKAAERRCAMKKAASVPISKKTQDPGECAIPISRNELFRLHDIADGLRLLRDIVQEAPELQLIQAEILINKTSRCAWNLSTKCWMIGGKNFTRTSISSGNINHTSRWGLFGVP